MMTEEFPSIPRTHAGIAASLRELPGVRDARVDHSEPYTSVRFEIGGVGVTPLMQRELSRSRMTITDLDETDRGTIEVVVRNVFQSDGGNPWDW